MAKRKQQLLHERDNQLAETMQQATICKQSAKIVQSTGLKEYVLMFCDNAVYFCLSLI